MTAVDDMLAALGEAEAVPALYHHPMCHGSQIARLALFEKDLRWHSRVVDIGPKAEDLMPWYLRLSPDGVLPVLVYRGRTVAGGVAIARFLDAAFEARPLQPVDPEARAGMERWVELAGTVDVAGLRLALLPGLAGLADRWLQRLRARTLAELRARHPALAEGYAALGRRMAVADDPWRLFDAAIDALDAAERALAAGRPYLAGDRLSLADLVWTALLARLRLIGLGPAIDQRPALAAYDARLAARAGTAAARVSHRVDWRLALRTALRTYAGYLLLPGLIVFLVGLWLAIRAG